MPCLLRAENVFKRFGGVHALNDVSVSLNRGEVHALMGENGAGKSTLGKILAGAIPADSGRIFLNDRLVTIANPHDAQRLGISIIFQELDLFPHLSIAENMVIGNLNYKEPLLVRPASMEQFCRPFLNQVGLDLPSNRLLKSLPIGKMQQVAIARALSMNVRLIVMDESTSSLTDEAVDQLFQLIRKLKASGVTIAYVSHKLDEVFKICDRVTVLRDGEFVATHAIEKIEQRDLIRLMVGREITEQRCEPASSSGDTLLSVKRLTTRRIEDISFDLHRGEVLGIAGLVGAGRTGLGAALFGLDRIVRGEIELNGKPYRARHPRDAMRRGLGLLPEDRKIEGLMMQMSVDENASLSILARLLRWIFVRRRQERAETEQIYRETSLKSPSGRVPVNSLSGGNQQKVLLARWLLVNPEVLFLDDPTRGVDVGAKQDIYGIIERMSHQGKGILLVSSELPELLRCCQRILVLQDGQLRGTVNVAETTQEEIMELATHVPDPKRDARDDRNNHVVRSRN